MGRAMQFPWLSSMNVGVPLLDAEHRHLFELLHELGNSVEQRNPSGARVLAEEYLVALEAHFRDEEAVMDRYGYPNAEGHKAEHRHCLSLLLRMETSVRAGRLDQAGEVLAEYGTCYFQDLLRDDSLLGRYLGDVAPEEGLRSA
jgi:hemerythrin-like metal-binding domain